MPNQAARRARAQAQANRRRAIRNQRRAQRRERRIRLANLHEREARLIAHIKKLRALHRPAGAINGFKMELVQVRERIRQNGGTPVPHPLREGKPTSAKAVKGPIRPSHGKRVAAREEDDGPVPVEDGPPPDIDEEEAAEGWEGPDAGWEEAGYDEAEAMLAGPPVRRAKVVRPPKGQRAAPNAAAQKAGAQDAKPGFFASIFKPDPEAIRRRAAARQARQAHRPHPKRGEGFLAKIFRKPVVQKVGGNMALTVRPGYRAAIMQVKPGLYVVAEVPAHAVRNGIGDESEVGILPLLLAPLIATAVQKRMAKRKRDQEQGREQKLLPGPVEGTSDLRSFMGLEGEDIPAWIDSEVAEEVGCPCEVETRR